MDLAALKAEGVVPQVAKRAKVIVWGKLAGKPALKGIAVSKGARAAIEAAGGTVELPELKPAEGKKAERRNAYIAKAKERAAPRSKTEKQSAPAQKPAKHDRKAKAEPKSESKPRTESKPKADAKGDSKAKGKAGKGE